MGPRARLRLSGVVQAWVPRAKLQKALGGAGAREIALATGLGAASSSCSYAAIAIAKSLFQKGASFAAAMVFQFASTNLVFELGIVMWIFLGWKFTLAEFVGGIVLIVLMWAAVRLFVSRRLEEQARAHALVAQAGHEHSHGNGTEVLLPRGVVAVAHNFRGDWEMLWKEILGGSSSPGTSRCCRWTSSTASSSPTAAAACAWWRTSSSGRSSQRSPSSARWETSLAAVLWAGGISFSGVIAFVFADLIVVPIVLSYRKYYGGKVTAILVAIMFVTIVAAALIVDGIFSALDLVPTQRPSIESISERDIAWNYTTVLNIVFIVVAAALFALTLRRGAKDPVCGMTVARGDAAHQYVRGQDRLLLRRTARSASTRIPSSTSGLARRLFLAHAGEHGHHD